MKFEIDQKLCTDYYFESINEIRSSVGTKNDCETSAVVESREASEGTMRGVILTLIPYDRVQTSVQSTSYHVSWPPAKYFK